MRRYDIRIILSLIIIYIYVDWYWVAVNDKKISIPIVAVIFTLSYLVVRMKNISRGAILGFILPVIASANWFVLFIDKLFYGEIWVNEYAKDNLPLFVDENIIGAVPYASVGLIVWIVLIKDIDT